MVIDGFEIHDALISTIFFAQFSTPRANLLTYTLGISLQAMDTSHVALVSLNLSMEGFEEYRCDQPVVLGINIANLCKVMKLADP